MSEACINCWHIAMTKRHAANPHFTEDERAAYAGHNIVLREKELEAPLKLRKPARIGLQFMGDLFLEGVGYHWQEKVWDVMEQAKQHTFLILTKRVDEMEAALDSLVVSHGVLPNVWLGATVENQARAEERIPALLRCRAAGHWVSVEPMLGAVDFTAVQYGGDRYYYLDVLRGRYSPNRHTIDGNIFAHGMCTLGTLDWVICGGETGSGARPMKLCDARAVRDQCRGGRVPFFFKQVGMWAQEFIPTAREWAIYSPVAGGWNYIRDRRSAELNAECGFTVWSRMSKKAPIPDDLMVRQYPKGMEA